MLELQLNSYNLITKAIKNIRREFESNPGSLQPIALTVAPCITLAVKTMFIECVFQSNASISYKLTKMTQAPRSTRSLSRFIMGGLLSSTSSSFDKPDDIVLI